MAFKQLGHGGYGGRKMAVSYLLIRTETVRLVFGYVIVPTQLTKVIGQQLLDISGAVNTWL